MAIYHCAIKTFSRSKGDSAVSAAAYRAGKKLIDDRTGIIADYTKKKGVVLSEIIKPKDSPAWANDTNQLWNKVEFSEVRKNSAVAREFEISLPYELDEKQRENLARTLTQNLVDRFGFVAEFSIHKPDKKESKNHHVHILASTRKITKDGFTEKTRELDEKTSGAVVEVREMVSTTINQHLGKAKIDSRVDHRSLMDQQKEALQKKDYSKALELSREPTRHIGKNPMFIEENKKHNEVVKKKFSDFITETLNKINQIIIKPKQHIQPQKQSQTFSQPKKTFLQSAEIIVMSAGNLFMGVIEKDWFGVEKREQRQENEKALLEKKREQQQQKKQQQEEEWKKRAASFNKANEEAFRNGYKKSVEIREEPVPAPNQDLTTHRKMKH